MRQATAARLNFARGTYWTVLSWDDSDKTTARLYVRLSDLAAAAPLALGETVPAVDRAVSAGLEWDLAFLPTVRTGGFVHLARPSPESATPTWTSTKRHAPLLLSDI